MLRKSKKGNLIYVETEYVAPENRAAYEEWAKAYKELADETNAYEFNVSSNLNGFSYIHSVGTEMSGVTELNQKRSEWYKVNPKAGELYDKYGYTVTYSKRFLWRHSPKLSYYPEGYESDGSNTYTRFYKAYLKQGKGADVVKLLEEYKAEWTKHDFQLPYTIVWNVFGEEQNCVMVVQSFKDRAAWVEFDKLVYEKIGAEKLTDMDNRWNQIVRKMEAYEGRPHSAYSHNNE